jgi:hypothetical protein
MADNSSTLPDALQDFLRHCAQSTLQVDSIKPTTQKIVKQALSDILEPIKPGRFLLETQFISRKNKVETVGQDEEEQTSEVEEEGNFDPAIQRHIREGQEKGEEEEEEEEEEEQEEQEEEEEEEEEDESNELDDDDDDSDRGEYGEAYVEVNHRPIAIWQYLGKEWSEQIVGFVQASLSYTTQLLTLCLMTAHSTEYSAFRATVLASHGTSPMATHWFRKAALLGFDEVSRWNLWR